MSEQYKLIKSIHYNDIQSKISNVLGVGSNDYGYGQTVLSSQVPLGAKISSNQWSNLRTDILKTRIHQSGVNESLTNPTVATTITDGDRQAYLDMATLCETNRTIIPPTSQATRATLINSTYTTAWNGTLTHTVTITFASAAAMRYYFNTGGFFDITASRTNGSSNLKNSSWSTMLTNIGTLRFGRTNTTRIDTGNNTTTISSVGYTGLTTADQKLYTKSTESTTYTPNEYNFSVKTANTGTQLIMTMVFTDLSGQPNTPWGSDEYIDGTISSVVESYRATGDNVSITLPSVSGTIVSSDTGSNNASPPTIVNTSASLSISEKSVAFTISRVDTSVIITNTANVTKTFTPTLISKPLATGAIASTPDSVTIPGSGSTTVTFGAININPITSGPSTFSWGVIGTGQNGTYPTFTLNIAPPVLVETPTFAQAGNGSYWTVYQGPVNGTYTITGNGATTGTYTLNSSGYGSETFVTGTPQTTTWTFNFSDGQSYSVSITWA
jgi:hypothetical protein